MRRIFFGVMIGMLLLAVSRSEAQTAKIQEEIDKKVREEAAKGLETLGKTVSLEQLIAEALKNNPDIRVAEAKVREGEADLARTRMRVVSELTLLQAEIDAATSGELEGRERWTRALQLYNKKPPAIAAEELSVAKLTYDRLKNERLVKQAKLPYLLGKNVNRAISSAWVVENKKWLAASTDEEFLRRVMLDVHGRLPTAEEMKGFLNMPEKDRRSKWLEQDLKVQSLNWIRTRYQPFYIEMPSDLDARINLSSHSNLQSSMTDKLRKVLDATTRMDVDNQSPKDVLEDVREKLLPGINLHVRPSFSRRRPSASSCSNRFRWAPSCSTLRTNSTSSSSCAITASSSAAPWIAGRPTRCA